MGWCIWCLCSDEEEVSGLLCIFGDGDAALFGCAIPKSIDFLASIAPTAVELCCCGGGDASGEPTSEETVQRGDEDDEEEDESTNGLCMFEIRYQNITSQDHLSAHFPFCRGSIRHRSSLPHRRESIDL